MFSYSFHLLRALLFAFGDYSIAKRHLYTYWTNSNVCAMYERTVCEFVTLF